MMFPVPLGPRAARADDAMTQSRLTRRGYWLNAAGFQRRFGRSSSGAKLLPNGRSGPYPLLASRTVPPEEFHDFEPDPNALHSLTGHRGHAVAPARF